MAITREARLKQVLQKLEKAYGKTVQPKKAQSTADFLVYLLLARKHAPEVAERSFNSLKTDFVDWNEVRVSSVREIGLSMKMKDSASKEAEARAVRECLVQMFRKKNNLSLEFLEELEFEKGVKALASFGEIDLATSVQVALHVDGRAGIQNIPHVLRVSRRVGLVEKRFGAARARTALTTLVSANDLQRFHRLMILVGEDTCQVKVTRCAECCLGEVCVSSKVRPAASRSRSRSTARAARGSRPSAGGPTRVSGSRPKASRARARKK
jgi:endonuclease III